jgi:hypothetical protein
LQKKNVQEGTANANILYQECVQSVEEKASRSIWVGKTVFRRENSNRLHKSDKKLDQIGTQ